jgi:hypothetical protein
MASVPFTYECDRESGFVADPNSHKRVGYLTRLAGFGLANPVTPDLTVSIPYSGQPKYSGITLTQPDAGSTVRTASVVAVLGDFSWAGGIGDALDLDFWCSPENASTIRTVLQLGLDNRVVKGLGWWIIDYDPELKRWFEQSFPASGAAVSGLIGGRDHQGLVVDANPAPVVDGIDVEVCKASISVVPAATQQYSLEFASSAEKQIMKSWGLVPGTLPATPA